MIEAIQTVTLMTAQENSQKETSDGHIYTDKYAPQASRHQFNQIMRVNKHISNITICFFKDRKRVLRTGRCSTCCLSQSWLKSDFCLSFIFYVEQGGELIKAEE